MMTLLPADAHPRDLLAAYAPGEGSLLAGGTRTLLARGAHAVVPITARRDQLATIAERAGRLLDEVVAGGHPAAVVVGAVPFDRRERARLVVPEELAVAGPLLLWPHDAVVVLDDQRATVRAVPAPEAYAYAVGAALGRLREGSLRKIVLARGLDVEAQAPVDVRGVVRNLAAADPRAFTFAVDLPRDDDGAAGAPRTLVGASPELLIRRSGLEVVAHPMAGSVPRHPDPVEDARRAAELLRSPKDRDEHAVVVDAVRAALTPLCSALDVPAGPELHRTATMWHLATRVRGRLVDESTSSLALVAALHPTPAVCGTPRDTARDVIAQLEALPRGFYSGALGWQDASGDGEWTVTIRCGEVRGASVRLWAGAGIVADSDPRAELDETTAKCRTMLEALGLAGEAAPARTRDEERVA
ncbi:Isochorismate synthase DhbC [Baekduia alba]|uniref:isochorismate synthase n=1 Tax=Baekduia alba TaxID=2997333 RepID=UPI002340C741|nr:isochorismate synthase [Baekduia alba]WCB95231.1 Isochorismate synthase DhbC [Baekduia alba]